MMGGAGFPTVPAEAWYLAAALFALPFTLWAWRMERRGKRP